MPTVFKKPRRLLKPSIQANGAEIKSPIGSKNTQNADKESRNLATPVITTTTFKNVVKKQSSFKVPIKSMRELTITK